MSLVVCGVWGDPVHPLRRGGKAAWGVGVRAFKIITLGPPTIGACSSGGLGFVVIQPYCIGIR